MFQLGMCYKEGKGVRRDDVQACCWFRRAACQDDVDAMFYLAVQHCEGEGVPKNYEQAVYWYVRLRLCSTNKGSAVSGEGDKLTFSQVQACSRQRMRLFHAQYG